MPSPLLLGIDLGGTKSAALIGNPHTGEILYRVSAPTPAQGDAETLTAFLLALAQEVRVRSGVTLNGCGVSAGAPANGARGIVYAAPNLPGWGAEGFPLAQRLTEGLQLPVQIENDADATALAEGRFGAGKGCANFAFLTVGTGIGAGLVLGGRLHRGAFGGGGEVGHICVDTTDAARRCNCGLRGCLEAYASGPAVLKIAQEHGYTGTPTGQAVTEAARAGDAACRYAFAQAAERLGRGLATLTMLLNLERVILGTLAVHAGDLLLQPVQEHLNRLCWTRLARDVTVVPAALGDRAQDLAALCAFPEADT